MILSHQVGAPPQCHKYCRHEAKSISRTKLAQPRQEARSRGDLRSRVSAQEPQTSTAALSRSSPSQVTVRPLQHWSDVEVRQVSDLQAEVFSVGFGVQPIDALLLRAFKGETLGILRQKLEYKENEGFLCLVAQDPASNSIVGVVEISLRSDKPELMALQEKGLNDTSYAYIASMAVPPAWRRRGVASALLASAERWAGKWHQNWVLLHAYQSNATARALYRANGYAEIKFDPGWVQLAAQKPRVLMAKAATVTMPQGTLTSISTSLMRIWQENSHS